MYPIKKNLLDSHWKHLQRTKDFRVHYISQIESKVHSPTSPQPFCLVHNNSAGVYIIFPIAMDRYIEVWGENLVQWDAYTASFWTRKIRIQVSTSVQEKKVQSLTLLDYVSSGAAGLFEGYQVYMLEPTFPEPQNNLDHHQETVDCERCAHSLQIHKISLKSLYVHCGVSYVFPCALSLLNQSKNNARQPLLLRTAQEQEPTNPSAEPESQPSAEPEPTELRTRSRAGPRTRAGADDRSLYCTG